MRAHDWPEHLDVFVRERLTMPFAWGANDCVTFGADGCIAMGCEDPIAGVRGWKTEAGALKKFKSMKQSLEVLLAERFAHIPKPLAGRGDIALLPHDGPFGGMVGLIVGDRIAAPGPDGIVWYPLSAALAAYRVS